MPQIAAKNVWNRLFRCQVRLYVLTMLDTIRKAKVWRKALRGDSYVINQSNPDVADRSSDLSHGKRCSSCTKCSILQLTFVTFNCGAVGADGQDAGLRKLSCTHKRRVFANRTRWRRSQAEASPARNLNSNVTTQNIGFSAAAGAAVRHQWAHGAKALGADCQSSAFVSRNGLRHWQL